MMAVTVADKGWRFRSARRRSSSRDDLRRRRQQSRHLYDVNADGQRFLMVRADENVGAAGIVVVRIS
jgi:hypothetical protein